MRETASGKGSRQPGHIRRDLTVTYPWGGTSSVRLPLVARRVFSAHILLVIAGFAACMFLVGICVFVLWVSLQDDSLSTEHIPMWVGVSSVGFGSAVFALLSGEIIRSHFADLCNGSGVILISQDSFWDRRATTSPIRWSEFDEAKVVIVGGNTSLHLRASKPVANRRPTLFGSRDRLAIQVMYFDIPANLLAFAIAGMVKQHGGTATLDRPLGPKKL